MSEKPPSWFRRHFGKKLKPGKGQGDASKASTSSTPTIQSRAASPSRADELPDIESQTYTIISSTSPKPSQVEMSTPSVLPSNASERLWDEAYDAISRDNAKLVEGYERILSQYLNGQGSISDSDTSQSSVIAANSPDVRRQQMNELIRAGLEKTAREAKVKDGLSDAMGIVFSLKNRVSTAIAAVPQASIAWSGVCVALGVLESAVKENASNRDGIGYIITRITWYGNVSRLLLDEGAPASPALSGMKSELEKRLVELYKALLIYQMKSVCSYHRNRSYSFLRDIIKLDNWAVSIQDIQKAEDRLHQDAEVYGTQQFRAHIETLAGHAKTQELEIKTMAKALEEQLRRQISSEDQECLRELWSHDPFVEKKRIEGTKGGLLQDSFKWILENEDFCRWFKDSHRPLLWIRGDPGKGKTMLLCGIVDSLQKLAPSSLISFFFCQATDERINNSTSVLRGLIFSLVDQQRHLLKHVREHYVRQGKSLFEPPSAWYALSGILQSLLSELSSSQQPTCLLVDALDECVSEDMPRLLDFIVKMSKELPYVKWVVSSRNWTQVIDKLKSLGPEAQLSLELNADSVATAVQIYINQKVSELNESKRYSKDKKKLLQEYLLKNANGTFLWVALVCQNLEKAYSWNVLNIMEAFPPGLDSFYEQMVKRLLQSQEAEICKRILAVATVALRPVTLLELIALAETPGEPDEKITAVRDLIGQCGSFLTIRDEVVYFVHQSAKDFLIKITRKQTFSLGIELANHYMAARSIKLMSEILRRDIYDLDDLGIHIDSARAPKPGPFTVIGYSCVFWIDHFVDTIPSKNGETTAGGTQETLIDDAETFIETKYLCWLEALSLLKKMPEGVKAMRKLQNSFKNESIKDSKGLIRDAYRFILAAKQLIEIFPLQIHPLAHLICPIRSKIRELSITEQPELFQMKHGMQLDWNSHMQTIEEDLLEKACIALSPDGKLMASASTSGVKIWDMATGTVLKLFHRPYQTYSNRDKVHLLFSPSGRQLVVSSSGERGFIFWNLDSGEHGVLMDDYLYDGCGPSFSSDGRQLASADGDDSVKIWDIASKKCILTLHSTGRIISVSFSSDGKLLASCSIRKNIKIWDDAGKCVHQSDIEQAWDTDFNKRPDVCFSPDISRLAFRDSNYNIKVLDINTSRPYSLDKK